MKNPFKYRPEDVPTFEVSPDEWADNWLSNFLAWASLTFLEPWCNKPSHFTSELTAKLYTSCPCCLLWRGLVLGGWSGFLMGLLIGLIAAWVLL